MDSGIEEIKNDPILRQIRRQALKVNLESTLLAALLTILVLLIPV